MPNQPLRILLTGVGAPGIRGTLYSLKQNPDNQPLFFVGVDCNPQAVGRHFVDQFYTVPLATDPSYPEELLRLAKKESIDVILPQNTSELIILSREKKLFEQSGIRIAVSKEQAIHQANDKWKLLQLFQQIGLPHPEFHLAKDRKSLIEAAHALGYPKVPVAVKPPLSNGMRGFRILKEEIWSVERFLKEKPHGLEISLNHLIQILENGPAWPELLVSEYLPGEEYSVDAFIGKNTAIAIPRLREVIRSGISFRNKIDFRKDLIDYTLTAAKELGLRYAIGFQFKLDRNGIPKVLECNPRIQGTMVASLFGGYNVIWMAVQECLGKSVSLVPSEQTPAIFQRYWGGFGLVGEEIHEI